MHCQKLVSTNHHLSILLSLFNSAPDMGPVSFLLPKFLGLQNSEFSGFSSHMPKQQQLCGFTGISKLHCRHFLPCLKNSSDAGIVQPNICSITEPSEEMKRSVDNLTSDQFVSVKFVLFADNSEKV